MAYMVVGKGEIVPVTVLKVFHGGDTKVKWPKRGIYMVRSERVYDTYEEASLVCNREQEFISRL